MRRPNPTMVEENDYLERKERVAKFYAAKNKIIGYKHQRSIGGKEDE